MQVQNLHASYFSGQTFKAHRLVLAACSPHFEQLFTPAAAHMAAAQALSNNQFYVILDGTRADDLQILLQFMYRGETYLQVTTKSPARESETQTRQNIMAIWFSAIRLAGL